MTVFFDPDADPVVVDSVADLDALLDRLAGDERRAEMPSLVEIVSDDEVRALDVGVGCSGFGVVVWHDDDDAADEVLASVGTVVVGEPVFLDFGGTPTTMPRDAAIPVDVARQAAREFLVTGRRPTAVAWRPPEYP